MAIETAADDRVAVLARSPSRTGAAEAPAAARATGYAWLAGALALASLFAWRTMGPALGADDVVQGDAREHIFWLVRYRDPDLFRDDLIADYFQSLAPPAFGALYWALTWPLDPLQASKLLPPLLGLGTALCTFGLVRRLHPAPGAAFLASVLLSWYVWQYDDLASGSPRALALPLLAAQLWALAAGRSLLAAGLVVLAALCYPVGGALGVTLLGVRLLGLRGWRPRLATDRSAWLAFLIAAGLAGLLLLPTQLGPSRFGPIVSAAQARAMPEFRPDGRKPFFIDDPYRYWVASARSGLDLRVTDALLPSVPILVEYAALAALLPLVLLLRGRLPSAARLSGQVVLLPQLLVASFGLFFLAHLLLFRLYFPSRYVKLGLPLVLAVAAGLAFGILVEALGARVGGRRRGLVAGGLALGLALLVAAYPAHYDGNFTRDQHPTVSAFLRGQPKEVLVAGVPNETDQVPTFASRRVLVSRESALPYHLGYHAALRQRTEDLIDGYYAESPRVVAEFAARYGVDLFLVNRAAFEERTYRSAWNFSRGEKPYSPLVERKLERPGRFALLDLAASCAAFDDGEVAVVPTSCLRDRP